MFSLRLRYPGKQRIKYLYHPDYYMININKGNKNNE